MVPKKFIRKLIALLFLLGTCASAQDQAAEKTAIDLIKKWAIALNNNDAKTTMSFYEESEKMMVLTSSGISFKGYKAMQEGFVKDFKGIEFSESSAEKISARAVGDVVIVDFEHRFKLHFRADKSRWQIHIRTTSVLRKINGDWKIVHEHSSAINGIERITKLD